MAKMAEVAILGQIVDQLKQLNKASATDMLREAENAKRAEQLMLQGETQTENTTEFIGAGMDFQRRFLAGQAKTFTDKALQQTGSKLDVQLQIREFNLLSLEQLQQVNTNLKWMMDQMVISYEQLRLFPKPEQLSNIDTPAIKEALKTNEHLEKLVNEIGPHSIEVYDNTLLEYFKGRDRVIDQQRNTDRRDAEERRREMMGKLGGMGGAGGIGAGGAGGIGDEEGGGLIPWLMGNKGKAGAVGGLGLLALTRKWFGWGTKAGFIKTMKGRFATLGAKIFPNSKMAKFVGPIKPSVIANPRKWPFLLAALVAGTFLASGNDLLGEDGGEDPSGDDYGPPDIDALDEKSAFSKNIDLLFTTAMVGGFLTRTKLVRSVSSSIGTKVNTAYKNAPKNSMRGRLYANAAFKRGLSLTGRSLLRFMGPWGFGLWVAWELGNIVMKQISDQETEADEAIKIINSEQISATESLLSDPAMATFFNKPGGPMQLNSGAKILDMKQKIREMMKGKSAAVQKRLKADLMVLGWGGFEIDTLINQANGTWAMPMTQNLDRSRPEGDLDRKLGFAPLVPVTNVGTIDNSALQIINQHYYLKGREVDTWTGKQGIAPIAR